MKWDDPDGGNFGGNSLTVRNKSLLLSMKFYDVLVARAAPDQLKGSTYEGKTFKQWLLDLAWGRLAEMEKRGIFPKGKG